jgi:hypothetical protein
MASTQAPASVSTTSTTSDLPVNRDPSVKLSPDEPPSKAPRKP